MRAFLFLEQVSPGVGLSGIAFVGEFEDGADTGAEVGVGVGAGAGFATATPVFHTKFFFAVTQV